MPRSTHPILLDVTRLLGRLCKGRLPTGVDRVGIAYVEHYGAQARATLRMAGWMFVLPKQESDRLFQWLIKPRKRLEAITIVAKALLTGWRSQRVAGSFLFNTGHSGLERRDFPDMLKRMQVLPILFVHDLIPITHPEYCRLGERDRHIARISNALRMASGIVVNSQATRDELMAFAGLSGNTMPPSVVGPLASGVLKPCAGQRPMKTPYFVVLSTIEPRKNHWLLLQIWNDLVRTMGESMPRLLVIGQRGWECENVVRLLQRCEQLKGYVYELSNCTDDDLSNYLQHAQALLFPSFAEGYGMPLVEALLLGVPVIVSDLPVFREVAAEVPEYVDPLDAKRWGELILDYAKLDSKLRSEQLRRLGDFVAPTWSHHFVKVDALLDQLRRKTAHV
jgi:glycosyltransferase involved in cell wall biosynthesis